MVRLNGEAACNPSNTKPPPGRIGTARPVAQIRHQWVFNARFGDKHLSQARSLSFGKGSRHDAMWAIEHSPEDETRMPCALNPNFSMWSSIPSSRKLRDEISEQIRLEDSFLLVFTSSVALTWRVHTPPDAERIL